MHAFGTGQCLAPHFVPAWDSASFAALLSGARAFALPPLQPAVLCTLVSMLVQARGVHVWLLVLVWFSRPGVALLLQVATQTHHLRFAAHHGVQVSHQLLHTWDWLLLEFQC